MSLFRVLSAFVLLILFSVATAGAQEIKRHALVIGNSAYQGLPTLKNAAADATLISGSLSKVGFDVKLATNTTKAGFERSLIDFRNNIEPGSTVVIYYAGHGLQVDDQNYLIPVDAQLTDARDLPISALSATQILQLFETTKADSIIFILDACRDNPFQAAGKSSSTRSISNSNTISRGLARIASNHTGTLIAFSTAPGAVAQDGSGVNSPYSEALSSALQKPGSSIEDIFKQTRAEVVSLTGGKQIPWENSSLVKNLVLVPKPEEAPVDAPTQCDLAAAHPSDPERIGPSVDYANLDPQRAIPACQTEIAKDPSNPRLKTLLARALDKAGRGEEAKVLNEEAMKVNYLGAWHNMGNLYRKGLGVERDLKKAFDLYLYAAERGHPEDQNNVGYAYFRGEGVPQDFVKARYWFEKATAQNWGASADKLGLIYLDGSGTKKDLTKAFEYFQKGADLGDRSAMVNLGNMFRNGNGTKKDHKKALETYRRAATLGAASAYVNLGTLYVKGEGIQHSDQEAAFWYTLASREGNKSATEQLPAVLGKLNETQKAELQERLDNWSRQRFG